MKIELEFSEDEIGTERLAALSREALRRRVPLAQLVREFLVGLADELAGKADKPSAARA